MNHNSANNSARNRFDNLLVLLERLAGLHRELGDVLDEKLEKMRGADMPGLHACLEREQALAERIGEQEGLRKQLMERLGGGYGIAPHLARTLPARRLAERLCEPDRGRIIAAADRLKSAVGEVVKRNRIINRVSTEVLRHLEQMFSTLTTVEESAGVYSQSGRTVTGRPVELFEAVG